MCANDWVPIAQVVSGLAAAFGLLLAAASFCLNSAQLARSRIVADLQALQKFFEHTTEREQALADAVDDREKGHAFNELLNFLELYAYAYNRGLFGKGSEELVRHKLEDAYIELDENKDWHSHIVTATDRSTTFLELCRFVAQQKTEIVSRAAERKRFRDGHVA